MSLDFVGQTFPTTSPWYPYERNIIHSVKQQIRSAFPDQRNLLINTTWFGPQFSTRSYGDFLALATAQQFDNLFLLATVDPYYLSPDQHLNIVDLCGAQQVFKIGAFDSPQQFDFFAQATEHSFKSWTDSELLMQRPDYVYICFNRNPRPHRIELVKKLQQADLFKSGIVTLGQNSEFPAIVDSRCDPTIAIDSRAHGIPNDTHSFGNIAVWQRHFLNVVSETEFFPWDEMFVSEKTWKPIVGLRPFVINGQTKIYSWLRSQGFRTFERWWSHIETQNIAEHQVCDAVVAVLKYLRQKSSAELAAMYADMLPDLQHNRLRYFDFCREQRLKINNLFHAG